MRTKIFILLLLILFSCDGCTYLVFTPREKQLVQNPWVMVYAPENVFFKTPEGLTLHGWFLRTHAKAQGSILVLHGNAENLSTHVNSVLWLVDKGFNIFIFDYQGYGRSQGEPTIAGVHRDAEAALEALMAMPHVDKEQIIVLGQSIGGAIAVYTVANSPYKNRIKALVLDSVFFGYRRLAREKLADFFLTWPFQYPLSMLISDSYSPERWIKKVAPVPVLIIQGKQDPVVPLHHGQMLYDAALQPKAFLETAVPGHIRSFADADVREKLVRYLTAQLQIM
jgi:fermentation-respiration switch protein FrsA (DUF1100 family)